MAAGERGELRKNGARGLRSNFVSATLGGMEGEFRYRGRVITAAEVEFIRQLIAQHPHTNRRQLSLRLCEAWGWKQANGALRDMVCRGTALATAAGRAPGVAARAASASQPGGPARHARGESAGSAAARYHSSGSAPAGAAALGVSASAAHAGGAALQLPRRPVSSARLRAAGGGTPQISGLGGGPGDRLPGLVVGAAASGRPRSLYRLVGGGAAPQYPFSRLQSSLSHFALGPRPAFGVARSRSDGAQTSRQTGNGSTGTPSIFSRPSSIPNATAARVIGRRTGW